MSFRTSLRWGAISGLLNIIIVLLGLTALFGSLVRGWVGLSSLLPGAWLVLLLVAFWGGRQATREADSWRRSLIGGALSGLLHGLLMAALVWLLATLAANKVDLRSWLAQLTPPNIALLTWGLAPLAAAMLDGALLLLGSLLGAALSFASAQRRWGERFGQARQQSVERVQAWPPLARIRGHKWARQALLGALLLLLLITPLLAGQYWNYNLGTVGIYVILGLGLNIVVGLAGLLDLGYVAFFAIGAYTVAMLTAPEPHGIRMDFWLTLPIAVILAGLSGVLLGIPVLRMRGDYLAIVTLGFGEIIRVLSKSDVLTGFTGGPRGIRAVGGPHLFGINLGNEQFFMYFILIGIVLAAFLTMRLQRSRVGRAWMAMREDEDVAEAMGINILKYKLLAFAIGASLAGFSGAIFASRNKFTGPEDFTLLVSINVLCLVIIGGMGSIPGVIMGALVLKGLPEMLRQLDDYRMLAFGALLVVMMIVRPEGIWPAASRKVELEQPRIDADQHG
jgi:branched-chain amino acid transport system permease protein